MSYYTGMEARMTIGELADAASLSRRAIRFYVQRGLLPSPLGLGRGQHYDATHLERLRKIRQLQTAGHSLDAIARILDSGQSPPPTQTPPARLRPLLSAELWTRLRFAEGIELHVDATRHNPDVKQLQAIRDVIRRILLDGHDPS